MCSRRRAMTGQIGQPSGPRTRPPSPSAPDRAEPAEARIGANYRAMTSPGSDPYAELGVPTGADQRTVRRAYLAKARAHHPDHGGNDRAMARINEPFELPR